MGVRKHELENGKKRIYVTNNIMGQRRRKTFIEHPDGTLEKVFYSDNQKRFPITVAVIK